MAALGLVTTAFSTIANASSDYPHQHGVSKFAFSSIGIILYGLGLLAAYRYHQKGILVVREETTSAVRFPLESCFQFAWFILISSIAMVIVLILAAIAAGSLVAQTSGPVTVVLIIVLIIALPGAILQVRSRDLDVRVRV